MSDEVESRGAALRAERSASETREAEWKTRGTLRFAGIFAAIQSDLTERTRSRTIVNDGWFLAFSRDPATSRVRALELVHLELRDHGTDEREPLVRIHTRSGRRLDNEGDYALYEARKLSVEIILQRLAEEVANSRTIIEPEAGLVEFQKQQSQELAEQKRKERKINWGDHWRHQLGWALQFILGILFLRFVVLPIIQYFMSR